MYYRVEVNHSNLGTVIETPFSLNPTRMRIAYDQAKWQLLSTFVDISLEKGTTLFNVCNAAVTQNLEIGAILPSIWEVLFERARPECIPIRRTECAFFFEKKENAIRFKADYFGMEMAVLCEVEIIKEVFSMKADMNWLNSINENTATAVEAINAFKKYWAGEMTDSPVMEVLFQGKYKLNPVE